MRKSGTKDESRQLQITETGRNLTQNISDLLDEMNTEEDQLLTQRLARSARTFERTRGVLAIAFGAVLLILVMDFRRLNIELNHRKEAEAAVRRLSGRILQLQDAERRKVAANCMTALGNISSASL